MRNSFLPIQWIQWKTSILYYNLTRICLFFSIPYPVLSSHHTWFLIQAQFLIQTLINLNKIVVGSKSFVLLVMTPDIFLRCLTLNVSAWIMASHDQLDWTPCAMHLFIWKIMVGWLPSSLECLSTKKAHIIQPRWQDAIFPIYHNICCILRQITSYLCAYLCPCHFYYQIYLFKSSTRHKNDSCVIVVRVSNDRQNKNTHLYSSVVSTYSWDESCTLRSFQMRIFHGTLEQWWMDEEEGVENR